MKWNKHRKRACAILLALSATVSSWPCVAQGQSTPGRQSPTSQQQQQQQQQRVLMTTAGRIAETPQRYYNQRVRVTAPVEQVHGKAVFTLDEDAWFAGPDVLVVAPGGIAAPREGNQVTVSGTVRQFVSAEIQRDYDWYGPGWYGYGWNDYNDVWLDWNTRPVIIADSVQTEGGRQLVQNRTRGNQQTARQRVQVVSPGTIAENPQNYYGRTVSSRSEVEEVFNKHLFTLDEDAWFAGPDVLVFVPRPTQEAPEDTTVTVIGQVQPFNINRFEQDFEWFDRNLFENIEDLIQWEQERRPAIVAQSVRTVNGRELVQVPSRSQTGMGAPGRDSSTIRQRGGGTQEAEADATILFFDTENETPTTQQRRAPTTQQRQQQSREFQQQQQSRSERQQQQQRRPLRGQLNEQQIQQLIADWIPAAKQAAQSMLQKYGTPQEATQQRLVWHNNGPWKRTMVINEAIQHNFPVPHHDVLEQAINLEVATDHYDDLARFDGSVIAERTRGELIARCNKEPANFLALNLAHDIIQGKKTAEEARQAYTQAIKSLQQGQKPQYTQALQFETPTSGTGSPGQAVLQETGEEQGQQQQGGTQQQEKQGPQQQPQQTDEQPGSQQSREQQEKQGQQGEEQQQQRPSNAQQ